MNILMFGFFLAHLWLQSKKKPKKPKHIHIHIRSANEEKANGWIPEAAVEEKGLAYQSQPI